MHNLPLIIVVVGLLGIGAQWIAWRTGLPGIALMLLAGVLAGPVTGLVDPQQAFGHLVEPIVSLAVAVILFEGGLTLNLRELAHAEGAVHRLVLLGVPIGWVLGALACYYVAGLVWPVAILFAGILVVTGPTVVIPLIRQTSIAARPRAILKWEAIVNDPLGALCAVITYEYLRQAAGGATIAGSALRIGLAALASGLIGYGMARAVAWAFPRGYVPEFLKAPVLLVAVLAAFVLSNLIQHETGLLTVTVMGITLANSRLASMRDFLPFKENITVILVSGVFILLSASLDLEVLRTFEWRFALFLLAILFLVRPATVLLSLAFSRIPWRERLFIAWIAPRGVVAVAVSGLFAFRLDELGYNDGGTLVALSFAVVVATIIAHGFSIGPAARLLGLKSPGGRGALIVGATPWSLSLARHLKALGVPVVVSDTSRESLAGAREHGVETFNHEILAEATEERLDFQRFALLAAVTDNEAYNALVCNEFAPELGRDSVYQLGGSVADDPSRLSDALRGRALFASGIGVEELHARDEAGWVLASAQATNADGAGAAALAMPDGVEPLLLVRANGLPRFFTHASRPKVEPGDAVIAFGPAKAFGAEPGWRVTPEEAPAGRPEPAVAKRRNRAWVTG